QDGAGGVRSVRSQGRDGGIAWRSAASPPLESSGGGGGWSRGRRVWRGPAGVLPRSALAPLERRDQVSQGLHRHIELLVGQVGGGPQAQHVPAVVGQHAALSEPAAELARVG